MPRTTTTRNPGIQPVGAYMPDAVRQIADAAAIHPNVVKMHDAVDRWIADAKAMPADKGCEYLEACLARIQSNGQNLYDWACDRAGLKKGLEGLTIDHIEEAGFRIYRALRKMREGAA